MNVDRSFIIVEGIRTHVAESGSGASLVLVHGLGGPLMWQRVIEPLASHFHVIVIDLPGWGESDCPPRPYSTGMYADFLVRLLDHLDVQKAWFVGISHGGQIAATVAGRNPEKAERLVLICSTGLSGQSRLFGSKNFWPIFSVVAKYTVLRNQSLMCMLARRSFYDIRSRPPGLCEEFFRQLSRAGKREAWLNGLRNVYFPDDTFRENLSRIRVPTLILWGENDRTVPIDAAWQFHRNITNSTLKSFPECGHSVPLEKPKELLEAVVEFSQFK